MLLNVTLIGLDGLCVEAAFARAASQVRLERLSKRPVKTLPAQVVDAVCTPFAPLRPAFLGLASILVRLLERYLCVWSMAPPIMTNLDVRCPTPNSS